EQKFRLYLEKVGLNQIVAYIPEEDEGLNLDNTRYAVVEVRERVPILVVDGDPPSSKRDESDLFPLRMMFKPSSEFDVSPGYRLDVANIADLDNLDLN